MSQEEKEAVNELVQMFTRDPKELKKKYNDEAFEKYTSKFEMHKNLWKLDDLPYRCINFAVKFGRALYI